MTKVRAVIALKADHHLETLLEIAGLARSTFFYHQARVDRPDPQAELKSAIREVFKANKGRYGHRRVHTVLRNTGWRIAKKTVLKLMRELDLNCHVRRKRRYVSYRGKVGILAPNLLQREFEASTPNQKWVTDVTEFRVGEDKIYLSPIMDLFDRQIIAYSLGVSPTDEFTCAPLRAALRTLGPGERPVVHSDQGFQYQHAAWQRLLKRARAKPSMSRKGNCLDNAVIESFFGHLKEELFHHTTFLSIEALNVAIRDYIHWYNHERIMTKHKGLSPVQYRAQALSA